MISNSNSTLIWSKVVISVKRNIKVLSCGRNTSEKQLTLSFFRKKKHNNSVILFKVPFNRDVGLRQSTNVCADITMFFRLYSSWSLLKYSTNVSLIFFEIFKIPVSFVFATRISRIFPHLYLNSTTYELYECRKLVSLDSFKTIISFSVFQVHLTHLLQNTIF